MTNLRLGILSGLAAASIVAAFISIRNQNPDVTPAAVVSSPPSSSVIASPSLSTTPTPTEPRHIPEPKIVQELIPFPTSRKEQMAEYAKRHYGLATYELDDPKVIVEHFTGGDTFEGAFATFAANGKHLGEYPGTCTHLVVDTDGTIYQLVPLDIMCRHAVGLNDTAIGIEMVGTSDEQILRNRRQYDAAVQLTAWLMREYGIELRNVIGHNESLTSPFHHERVASWRCQTHDDWNRKDMKEFRRSVEHIARRYDLPLGPPAEPVTPDC